MEESVENENSQKKLSFVKDRIALITTAVIITSSMFLKDFFNNLLQLYCFFLFLFLIDSLIQQILNKEDNQPFDYKKFFKKSVFYSVALLVSFCLFEIVYYFFAVFSNILIPKP